MRRRLGDNPTPAPVAKPQGEFWGTKDEEDAHDAFQPEPRPTDPAPPPPSMRRGESSVEEVPTHLSRGFERIVRSIFDGPELDEEWEELRRNLQFEDRASSKSHGQIQDALDRSTENAQRAAELLARAKVNLERFEAYAAVTQSAIRERAHAELTTQKEDGTYRGRFSKDDVEAAMATIAADEYSALNIKRAEVKRAIDALEALASNWVERTRNLRAMLAMGRGV
jgi:hypothetical protein